MKVRCTVFLEIWCFAASFRVDCPRLFWVLRRAFLLARVIVTGRPVCGLSSSVSAFLNLFFQICTVDGAQPTFCAVSRTASLQKATNLKPLCSLSWCCKALRRSEVVSAGHGARKERETKQNKTKQDQKREKIRNKLLRREGMIAEGEGKFYMCIFG